jgi:transcriptional regulator with XRE-family HTH domain
MSTEKSQNTTTSEWVRSARKSKGLTQKDLAVKLKISKKSLENYESGRVDVPTATAIGVYEICEFPHPFLGSPLEGQPQNKDAKGDRAVEDGGEEVTAKYISLLEQNIKKLEQENEELKAQIRKSSKKPKAHKKK